MDISQLINFNQLTNCILNNKIIIIVLICKTFKVVLALMDSTINFNLKNKVKTIIYNSFNKCKNYMNKYNFF
jgi:hypothetical protein